MSKQKDLFQTESNVTLSPGGSPAWTFQHQADKKELKEVSLDFGKKCTESLASYDQSTSSWRMSQLCLVGEMEGGLVEYSETWPDCGTMQRGIAYRQHNLVRYTKEKGSSFYPTPAAHEGRLGYQRRDTGKKGTQKSLTTVVVDLEGGRNKTTGQLNPTWVDWLMGFPIGWTDLNV